MGKVTALKIEKQATSNQVSKPLRVPSINQDVLKLRVVGISPLVTKPLSEKTRESIAKKQEGIIQPKKGARKPEEEYEASRYVDSEGRDCFPARNFKKALVSAYDGTEGITRMSVTKYVYVLGDLLPLKYKRRVKRMDWGRNNQRGIPGTGPAVPIYRMEYQDWSVDLTIEYDANQFSADEIVGLLRLAGRYGGIGEMRPQKTGLDFGRFDIEMKADKVGKNGVVR